jgi:hypothetical protein
MGDRFQRLAAPDVTRSDASAAAARVAAWFQHERSIGTRSSACVLGSKGNRPGPEQCKAVAGGRRAEASFLMLEATGLEVVAAPVVHCTIDPAPFEATCPTCGARCGSDVVHTDRLTRVDAWQRGHDRIDVARPHCARGSDLLAWRINHIVLAHLALAFWNWPQLADGLIAGVSRLAGSHILTLSGKL